MKNKIFLLVLIINALLVISTYGQEDSIVQRENLMEEIMERLENQFDNIDENSDFIEDIDIYLQNENGKINLNQLDAEVAYNVLHLTDYQYYQLLLYIEKYGELVSIYEVAAIDGFDQNLAEKLSKFVEVKATQKGKNPFVSFFKKSKSNFLIRYRQIVEPQAGYEKGRDGGYLGNPMRLTFKYNFTSGEHFAMALSGEKDAGEEFFKGTQKQGFDHYGWFLNFKNIGILKNCVIGDYTLSFGQGLMLGGRSMGVKGSGAASVRRFPALIRGTAPMNESTNFRGTAVTLGNAYYTGTIFYSHRFFDGESSIGEDGNSWFEGSLTSTGYHRTDKEIETQNTTRNRVYGAHFQVKRRIFELGVTGLNTQFVNPVATGGEMYQKYRFAGRSVANGSIDYKVILHKTILFGEAGMSFQQQKSGFGIVQGAIFDMDPRSKLSFLFRYYSPQFISLNGSAISAYSSCNNELGCYIAADFVLGRKTSLFFNADYYHVTWLKFHTDKPSYGGELQARFCCNITRNLVFNLKYKFVQKEQNSRMSDYYQSINKDNKHILHATLNCTPMPWLNMKTEVDWLWHAPPNLPSKQGFLIFQDIGIQVDKINLGVKMRFALFNTDSYDERQYAYEQDLLYTFTINSYYGKGIRYYFMVDYKFAFVSIQARFAQTYFDDRAVISSGLSKIEGNTKSEVALQIIFHMN